MDATRSRDPHASQPLTKAGPDPQKADGVIVLIHGRGATAGSMLPLLGELDAGRFAVIAPQAAGHTWYPQSFLAPLELNQPYLDSALAKVESVIAELIISGVPSDKIALVGFSQGACLILESVARHPRRYGAVIAFTGGLIGPPGTPRNYEGSLAGTPIFLGTSDPDPHVPFERVTETQSVLKRMGAQVEVRRYAGMPHTINEDELDAGRQLLRQMLGSES